MAYEIKFSHIFNENIERIFEIFTDFNLASEIAFKEWNLNIKASKENCKTLLEEDAIYSCKYKNYYNLSFHLEKNSLKNRPMVKYYTHIFNLSGKIEMEYKIKITLYYDTIDRKTIYTFCLTYEDEFFSDLLRKEYNTDIFNSQFVNVENYLANSMDKAEYYHSSLLNKKFEVISDFLSHPKLFLKIFPDDLVYDIPNSDVIFDIFDMFFILKTKDNDNKFIKITPVSLICTLLYYKLTINISLSKQKPSYKITFELRKLDLDRCFLSMLLEYIEPMSYSTRQSLEKFWRKRFKVIQKLFDE